VNLLADESIDRQIVDLLRQDGHLVHYVAEMEPGISDDTVLNLANQNEAILLTADKDFGELVFRQHRLTLGVVLVRLTGMSPDLKAQVVSSTIGQHSTDLPNHFAVITPGVLRIRRADE
jgi:predicted nuclease of predicted toxin-antitoxin system